MPLHALLNTRPIRAIRRAWLVFQLRCIEATIAGQTECIACVGDPLLQARIMLARNLAKTERFKLKAQLHALTQT